MIAKRTVAQTKALMQVALGQRPAEVYIANGKVVNVYSGEILPQNVAIYEGHIAYVGKLDTMVDPETQIIDAAGSYLVPGFIDPHTHLDILYNPYTLAQAVLPRGTTAVLDNSGHLPRVFRGRAYEALMAELSSLPLKVLPTVKEGYGALEEADRTDLDEREIERLLAKSSFYGISEVGLWTRVLNREEPLLSRLTIARSKGKRVEGHTSGATYEKLNALAASGFTSCHESLTTQEALERLRLGLYVMLRHSSTRKDLDELVRLINDYKVYSSRMMLTRNGMTPLDLQENGHMDYILKYIMNLGIDPLTAIKMATINAATYLGLDTEIGGIAPGRYADILFIRDIQAPRPHLVMANGRTVANEGMLVAELSPPSYSHAGNKYKLPAKIAIVQPWMFQTPASGSEIEIPIMHFVNVIVNRIVHRSLKVKDGYISCMPEKDIIKVALVDREGGRVTNGFATGLGLRVGALVSTANSAHYPTVLGCDEQDMALAVNRVIELEGGMVLVDKGSIIHELPLPLGGVMSLEPVNFLAQKTKEMIACLKGNGFKFDDPYYTLSFLSSLLFPELRITSQGLYDVKKGKIILPSMTVA